jgi:molybdate transport system substrate-binding protein
MQRRFVKGLCPVAPTFVLLVALTLGLAACRSGTESTSEDGEPQVLTISAAASLKSAFTEIGAAFDTAKNARTTFSFAPAGMLQQQIEAGASVDVFASAAMRQMNALLDAGLVDRTSVKVFAGNEIVLIVPADSMLGITGFEDLAKSDVRRVVYGDPAVSPYGVAAEEILSSLGIYNQVKPKVVYALNIAQALEYVARGEVDAGITFFTEAKTAGDRVKIVATSQPSWHSTIAYPAAVVGSSPNKALAQAFVDFVAGPDGQAILGRYGFLPAPTE